MLCHNLEMFLSTSIFSLVWLGVNKWSTSGEGLLGNIIHAYFAKDEDKKVLSRCYLDCLEPAGPKHYLRKVSISR